jgi:peptidoglycan/xylan/chitin deacetylase (PgdA/CDA1 family)
VLNYLQIFLVRLLGWFHPEVIWNKKKTKKTVYLTFDDGPTPIVTPKVLEILEKYQIKATFFCIGKNVLEQPEIYQSILQKRHAIGNHSQHHLNGWKTSKRQYIKDVEDAAVHIQSRLFRPPYGKLKLNQLQLLRKKFTIIMWDVITYDYDKSKTPYHCIEQVKKFTRDGSIIVFHDSVKAQSNVLSALPASIEFLMQEGYEFSTLD